MVDLDYIIIPDLLFIFVYLAGELGKLEMLHEGILHKCIKQLLEKKKNIPLADMSEDLECLCHLMRTVGRRLDTNKAKVLSGILFGWDFRGSKWSFLRSAHTPD